MYEENVRLMEAIDDLMSSGQVSSYKMIADALGIPKASITDIKMSRKKVSVELLRGMKKLYKSIDIQYIIMGEREARLTPQHQESPQMEGAISIIQEQAKEIGRLEAQVEMYQEEIRLLKQELDYQYNTAHSGTAPGEIQAG